MTYATKSASDRRWVRGVLGVVLCLSAWSAAAQPTAVQPPHRPNEIGLRYTGSYYLGPRHAPELSGVGVEYAHYGRCDVGFRTGLEVAFDSDFGALAVPFHLSWRTGPLWGPAPGQRLVRFTDILLAVLPRAFELHAGPTGGLMVGATDYDLEPGPHPDLFSVRRYGVCTLDAGCRVSTLVGRLKLSCDVTCRCCMTRNFESWEGEIPTGRSYIGVGVAVAYIF